MQQNQGQLLRLQGGCLRLCPTGRDWEPKQLEIRANRSAVGMGKLKEVAFALWLPVVAFQKAVQPSGHAKEVAFSAIIADGC